ncbi:VOC family protein [Pullulanibacillus sp. KACC 23026]|uniref:VOC family protein n=1 Tax=Pullulanibacillus sp. KACC 23026 TaxID=3028315 RepID=UPI0023AEE402|nr:VOC family protein [Pullulanibacillus sp. KACC 23026]WEG11848.1 VOC family protein [Pullulanibacillus sp. KACC 23026]
MKFDFDHLVHLTKRPEEAVQAWKDLGFHAANGGHHENWGTYNGIAHFGLSYIEFLGLENASIARQVTDNTLIQQTAGTSPDYEGFLRLAFRTTNMNEAVAHFKNQGLRVIGPVPGERRRTDGSLLKWEMLFIEEENEDPYNFPFIIDWKMSDSDREQQLKDQQLMIDKMAAPTLSEIGIYTAAPAKTARAWQKLFNLELSSGMDSTDDTAVKGSLGSTAFVFHRDTRYGFNSATFKGKVRPSYVKIKQSLFLASQEIYGGLYLFNGGS